MSYDVYIEDGPEPYFADTHPAFDSDGFAGTAVMTATGYARCGNYTSNVSGMWAACLTAALAEVPDAHQWCGVDDRRIRENYAGTPYGQREISTDRLCLRDLHGARAGDLVPLLTAAVEWGVEHIGLLRQQNPPNGWGNAEGAATFLWDIQRLCEANPDGTLGISS